jgi:hypothetical protein
MAMGSCEVLPSAITFATAAVFSKENAVTILPLLVLYQLVLVNYGEFASPDDAETFGAAATGLSRDEYYAELCEMEDQLAGCSVA